VAADTLTLDTVIYLEFASEGVKRECGRRSKDLDLIVLG